MNKNNDITEVKKEILIVEDSPTQAKKLRLLLEKHGYKASVSPNGKKALAFLNKNKPAVVISDIVMPVMDGYELCHRIKSDASLKQIPVILLTALSDPEDVIKGLKSGADNFVTKPYSEKFILTHIHQTILNTELRKDKATELGLQIYFAGKKHMITSNRLQVVDLLLSTFENAVQKSRELAKANKKLLATQNELNILNKKLEEKVKERTQYIKRINLLLYSIRKINQLITKEERQAQLLKGACSSLIATRGYHNAWSALLDRSGKVTTTAEAGLGKDFIPMLEKLKRRELPDCARKTLSKSGILTVKNPFVACPGCPLAKKYEGGLGMAVRLKHGKRILGWMALSASKEFLSKEEQDLLQEVASDIALALHNMEMEVERKAAEKALEASEEKFRTLTNNINVGVYRIEPDFKGAFIEANPATIKMFGYKSKEEFLQTYVADLYQDPKDRKKFINKISRNGFVKDEELNLKKKNGSPITASFSTVAVKNKKGKILYHDGIIEDITERKQMEQKLRESQKRYETLTESSPVGVFHADAKGDCTYVNNRWVSIAGLPPEGARHKGWMKALHPEDKKRVSAEWHQSCQEKKPFSSEFRFQRPDGTTAWVFSLAAPEENTEGEVTSYVGTVTDITGLKMAEEQIKTSLREKEVLLQEVHHRVKNNMQVMSSLFNLQSQQIKDKRSLEMFKSMQNRVRSIALIHERLYQAKNYTRVNFAEYIQGLTKHLFSVYGIDSNKINLKLNIEDVFLDINTAIPCGLIINELATNAIKHAFPNGEKGEIKIDMHPVDSKEVELIIADDGVGTPKSVDPKSPESLGLHLVTLLAESQLQGEIKLDRNKGTRFRIKFKVKK